jgi:hypothetical protein
MPFKCTHIEFRTENSNVNVEKSYCARNVRKNVQKLRHVPVRCNLTGVRDFGILNVTVVTAGVPLWRAVM